MMDQRMRTHEEVTKDEMRRDWKFRWLWRLSWPYRQVALIRRRVNQHYVYVTVDSVTWPAWEYEHDPGVQSPVVLLRGRSDEEWRDLFAALEERRRS